MAPISADAAYERVFVAAASGWLGRNVVEAAVTQGLQASRAALLLKGRPLPACFTRHLQRLADSDCLCRKDSKLSLHRMHSA